MAWFVIVTGSGRGVWTEVIHDNIDVINKQERKKRSKIKGERNREVSVVGSVGLLHQSQRTRGPSARILAAAPALAGARQWCKAVAQPIMGMGRSLPDALLYRRFNPPHPRFVGSVFPFFSSFPLPYQFSSFFLYFTQTPIYPKMGVCCLMRHFALSARRNSPIGSGTTC